MTPTKEQSQAALSEIREIELPAGRYKINGEYRDVSHTFRVTTALEAMAGGANLEIYRAEAHRFVGMEYTPFGKCPLPSNLNQYGYAQNEAYLRKLGEMMFHLLNVTAQPPKGQDDA